MSRDARVERLKLPGKRVISRSLESVFEKFLNFERVVDPAVETGRKRRRGSESPGEYLQRLLAEGTRFYRRRRTSSVSNNTRSSDEDFADAVEFDRGREINLADFSLLNNTLLDISDISVNKMPEHMTLKEARTLIPRFDGTNPDEVDDIIEAYAYADESVAAADKAALLKAVMATKVVERHVKTRVINKSIHLLNSKTK